MSLSGITVCITTYCRYEQVKRAVRSVMAQTQMPDEVIVVEDGPPSGVEDWLNLVCNKPVRYIRHDQNKGLAAARNTGLKAATYDWISYLDDDNEWLPDRLKETIDVLTKIKNQDLGSLACLQVGTYTKDQHGKIIRSSLPKNDGNLKQSIITYGPSTLQSSFFFNKKALLNVGGFDEGLVSGTDHDIWMKLAVAGYNTLAIKKPLVIIHQDNIPTMMTNTRKRIIGVTQYVEKWTPTYKEWFGAREGEQYAKAYFAKVIGRLICGNLSKRRYKQALGSFVAIHAFVKLNLRILLTVWLKTTKHLVKTVFIK